MVIHGSFCFALDGLPKLKTIEKEGGSVGVYLNDSLDPGQVSHVSVWVGPEQADRVKRGVEAWNAIMQEEPA